jgi:hypothetical protein
VSVTRYFPTVDWFNEGRRGIFCDKRGQTFASNTPHTKEELWEKIGVFFVILSPRSEALTEDELSQYKLWSPLAEYGDEWGIARTGKGEHTP